MHVHDTCIYRILCKDISESWEENYKAMANNYKACICKKQTEGRVKNLLTLLEKTKPGK